MTSYFIKDQYLGESSSLHSASLAYFCRRCGEIWARIVAVSDEWQLLQVPCYKHLPSAVSDWGTFPGSLLNNFIYQELMGKWAWAAAIEALPPAAIQREFEIHLSYYEKEVQNG